MEKEFIPYEQALALKQLGFDEPCLGVWNQPNGEWKVTLVYNGILHEGYINDLESFKVTTPTFSQAFRFFREKYNLSAVVSQFGYGIENRYGQMIYYTPDDINPMCFEESELECLKRLIETAKTNNMKNKETLEEVAKLAYPDGYYEDPCMTDRSRDAFIEGASWQREQILNFLYEEITERRDYSASKMCEEVIKFIESNEQR